MDIIQYIAFDKYKTSTKKGSIRLQRAVLETLFEGMTRIGIAYLKVNPRTPLLYESGVVYEREYSPERWYDIPSILKRGADDCEGLAIWLAAEARTRAPNSIGPRKRPMAVVVLKQTKPGLWHALVQDKETGELFDPSRQLGM